MSATSSVGADRTPPVDTMMEKVALFCWHKFVYLGIKSHRKMNLWHGEGLGEYPQECGLIHLKLRTQVDSDIRETRSQPCWSSSWHTESTRTWSISGLGTMHQGLWGLLGDKNWLTAPTFKELFSWETEPILATYPAGTCAEIAQGVKYASWEYQKTYSASQITWASHVSSLSFTIIVSMYSNTRSTENLENAIFTFNDNPK